MDGECEECRKQGTTLQRSPLGRAPVLGVPPIVREVLRSPGWPLDAAIGSSMRNRFATVRQQLTPVIQTGAPGTLAVNQPGDRYEQEAEQVADRVVRQADALPVPGGHTFSKVRVHTDSRAAESARAVGALAYTVGDDIVFGSGRYAPETSDGQHLLAHELTHTLQQSGRDSRLLMGTWDKAEAECANAEKDRWIDKVVVNQEGSQTVAVHWTDDSTESDECSSGKGHCCVDDANPSGVACTVEESHRNGSNCTPITRHMGFPVKNRVLDHKGVNFWSEFVPERAIALHQYDDQGTVDGTPLSHGCVRLHENMAKKIFCNVRQNQTWVQVQGFARPKCSTASLQTVWQGDFDEGGKDLSQADGDEQAEIREVRRELNEAFGRTLTVEEIRGKKAPGDIPRCTRTAPLPKPTSP
jgi:hypothetical protein